MKRLRRATGRARRRAPLGHAIGSLAVAGFLCLPAPPASADTSGSSTAPAGHGVTHDGKVYSNRLIASRDPYLLMHAHNPVDWYPWGPDAFAAAKRENKPIFLSVGYSTCYWCHVAEREIYSNPEIARLMNAWFINVKVDREERPDVDGAYMLATQLLTGGGGWPNNLFLTPDLKPFYAGSYFPPEDRDGQPGFPHILAALNRAWTQDPAKVNAVAEHVDRAMREAGQAAGGEGRPDPRVWIDQAIREAARQFDELEGGFSGTGVTKFPQAPLLSLLLAEAERGGNAQARSMLAATLRAMAEGGVMDQIGGGFHRYSTDPGWNVPHFEKMLYDNAQLLALYARGHALTGDALFGVVAQGIASWLEREMRAPDGGFYSAQDAEVEGVEGASYLWTQEEIRSVLGGTEAERFLVLYRLTPLPQTPLGHKEPQGAVLRMSRDLAERLADSGRLAERIESLAPLREKLLAARKTRPQPATDTKILTAGNALAILGLLEAGSALQDPTLGRAAVATATWLWDNAYEAGTGVLHHQIFQGRPGGAGLLDDYALLGQAFLTLHESTRDAAWRQRAQRLADSMLLAFQRPDGSLATSTDTALPQPPADGDSVQPSGQSAAVALLLELAADGDVRYALAARRALSRFSQRIGSDPGNWGSLLASLGRSDLAGALERSVRADAQGPDSAGHVHASARLTPDAQGLSVALAIDAGFHINANPASDKDLIPTTLTLEGLPHVQVEYPPGRPFRPPYAPRGIDVYSGRVELRARLPADRPPPSLARLRVQACDDHVCLAPSDIDVPLQVPPNP